MDKRTDKRADRRTHAYQLMGHIDYEAPDCWLGTISVAAALDLASLFINLEEQWCFAVSYPASCLPHDGFVTTVSQTLPGGFGTSNFDLVGAAHTKQPGHGQVIDLLRQRLDLFRP